MPGKDKSKNPFTRYLRGRVIRFPSPAAFEHFLEAGIAYARLVAPAMPTVSAELSHALAPVALRRNWGNRPIHVGDVTPILVEMRMHDFLLCADPITITQSGRLGNGQKRLTALVDYNRPLQFQLTFGIPDRDSDYATDRGQSRTTEQLLGFAMRVAGAKIYRAAYFAPSLHERKLSTAEWVDLVGAIGGAVPMVRGWFCGSHKKIQRAYVLGAAVRALSTVEEPMLRDFVALLCDSESETRSRLTANRVATIATLRRWLEREEIRGSNRFRKMIYAATTTTIAAFVANRRMGALRGLDEKTTAEADIYPRTGRVATIFARWDGQYKDCHISPEAMAIARQAQQARLAASHE